MHLNQSSDSKDNSKNLILIIFRQSTFVFRKPSITGLKYEKSKIGRMGFLKRMETRCKKTRTRVIKTIRMNMTEMLSLLSSLPEEGRVSRYRL